MKIVVMIPTYNEKENIEKMLPLLENEVFPKIQNHNMHILVADDTSPDGTKEEVEKSIKKWSNIHLLEGKKEGLGSAYIRAMHYAMNTLNAEAVIEFDADFQHDPHDIPRLVAAMDQGYDYVIGSRYIKGGQIPKEWGLNRKIKSFFGSLLARIVLFTFSIHDMTSGFKLTKTSFLKQVDLDHLISRNYAYKLQILFEIVLLGAKVKEIPIIFYERSAGKSKMETNDIYDSLKVIFTLRLRESMRIIKFLFVGGTGFVVQIIVQESTIRTGLAIFLAMLVSSIHFPFLNVQNLGAVSNGIGAGFGAEAAIVSNFLFNNFWTFNDTRHLKQTSPFVIRAIKFNLASLLSIAIQTFAVYLGVRLFGENISLFSHSLPTRILILFPTIIFLVIPLNYIIYNMLIWKTRYLKHDKKTSTH